jgi:general secretion pathway protein G
MSAKKQYGLFHNHDHRKVAKLSTDRETKKFEYTVFEVMTAILIICCLAAVGISFYHKYQNEAHIRLAITELKIIEKKIVNRVKKQGKLPEDLSDIGLDKIVDPWGRPYKYLKIYGNEEIKAGKIKPKKNEFQYQLNTDFDLYSVGKDGDSADFLAANISRDDIIRANNGNFMGMVSDY